MSEQTWQPLIDELARWNADAVPCRFWWRDDDLITATPKLNSLHALADECAVQVLVAVIPAQMSATLGADCAAMPRLAFCQHGYSHRNHAAAGQPDTEFPADRDPDEMTHELQQGRDALLQQFGSRLLPVFVPPWNHFPEDRFALLSALGLRAISLFNKRDRLEVEGLLRVDTHLDVVDWTAGPGFPPGREELLIERLVSELHQRREQRHADDAPLGILTHHMVMDLAAWQFMRSLLRVTQGVPGVEWMTPRQLFPRQ